MLNPIEIVKNLFKTDIHTNKNKIDDLISFLLIQDLVKFREYFPATSSSIRFHTLAVILNDIILNKRQNCLEFGTGVSTLAMANLIKNNHLNCNLFSIEDDIGWFNYMKSCIEKNDLEKNLNLIYAPLEKTNLALENNSWYSLSSLNEKIDESLKFDLVVIDGPGAWKPEKKLSRYTAIPYLVNKLADNYSVYLDDINRKGEKMIISLWHKKYKMKFERINDTTAVYMKGSGSNIII